MALRHRNRPAGSLDPPTATVVVERDQALRRRLAADLGAGAVAAPEELVPRLGHGPLTLVVGPSWSDPGSLADLEPLLLSRAEVGAVLVSDHVTTELLQQALRAGVRDVLAEPVDPGDLAEAVGRVAASLRTAPGRGDGSEPSSTGGAAGRGSVTTVFSTKGGAGTSVVATNLAVALARRSDGPVALVDADLQFGDVAVMLKLVPRHTIVDAVAAVDRLDRSYLDQLLVRHEPSGLLVLPAPIEPSFADQITAGELGAVIDVLRTFCAHVVVDTPAYFNDVVLGLIEASDDVVLVAGMDIPTIKDVKIGLQTLRLLDVPADKLQLLLNRTRSRRGGDVGEVERTLGLPARVLVPSDDAVTASVNKGVPIVLDAPRSATARALVDLAERVAVSTRGAGR